MRNVLSGAALLGLMALAGCGGGSGGGGMGGGSQNITVPPVSATFSTGNAAPGVDPAAGVSSGTGAAQPTTGSGAGLAASDTVARIQLSPSTASVEANRRLTFTALGVDAAGSPVAVPAANWQWTSSDPTVALLTSTGDHAIISGVKAGTATIRVLEGKSGVTAQVTLTVTAPGVAAPVGGTSSNTTPTTPAAGTTVYANDFANGAGKEWSKQTIDTTPGTSVRPAAKFLGQFAAGTVSLNLGSLPTHNSVTVTFDLFIIRTWDGNAADPSAGPDIWDLSVEGGPTLLHTTFANVTPQEAAAFGTSYFQAFPDSYPGGSHPYQTGAASASALGYTHIVSSGSQALPSDAVYHLTYTFPHTAAGVKLNFTSGQTQDVTDESWGLKNVAVTVNP